MDDIEKKKNLVDSRLVGLDTKLVLLIDRTGKNKQKKS